MKTDTAEKGLETRTNAYLEAIPPEWNGPTTTGEKITTYLTNCIANFQRIRFQLESLL